ncbi:MAG TPA: hypothetical protein VFC81_04950, partial [Verrucomicrobiae bacterium]|nr:hypothetical protein [Verrucomicrobiae bacterium]
MNPSPDVIEVIPALVAGFVLAFIVSLGLTPLVRKFARRRGMVDRPEARRVNTRTVARGGGVAIAVGFISVSLLMLALNFGLGLKFVDQTKGVGPAQLAALLGGGALAAGIGLLD